MTLENKMNKLRKEVDEPFDMFDPNFGDDAHNLAIDECVALVKAEKSIMTNKLYVAQTLKSIGTDEDGTFAILAVGVRTDTEKAYEEVKIYLGGRAWFSSEFDNYAYSPDACGNKINLNLTPLPKYEQG